jgi:hypothetical protein
MVFHKLLTATVSPEVILPHDLGICVPSCVPSAFKVLGSACMDLQVAWILRKL